MLPSVVLQTIKPPKGAKFAPPRQAWLGFAPAFARLTYLQQLAVDQ